MPSSYVHHDHERENHAGTVAETKVNEEEEEHVQPHDEMTPPIRALQMWLQQQQPISIDTIVQPEYWPPRNIQLQHYYDWSLPTHEVYKYNIMNQEENHGDDETVDVEGHHHHPLVAASFIEDMCNTNYRNDTMTDMDGKVEDEQKEKDDRFVLFTPTFCEARSKLDYTYHTHVVKQRQYLQDAIIQRIVSTMTINSTTTNWNLTKSMPANTDHVPPKHRPWIVFTAGPMGVGKGYVITQLQQLQLFNVRDHFITIDPDLIKYEIPEMVGYLQIDRNTAATKVHRESTQISDIIFEYAILHSLSILVDGSLRDVDYYQSLFHRIRKEYPQYRIGIIHITATRDVIMERATSRAIRTGRVIPKELLEDSIAQVPKSVELLSPLADAVHVIANHPNRPLQLVSSTLRRKTSQSLNADKSSNGSSHTSKVNEDDIVITTTSWKDFKESWGLPAAANTPTPNGEGMDSATSAYSSNGETVAESEERKEISIMDDLPEAVVSDTLSSLSQSKPSDRTGKKKVLHTSISMSQFVDDHSTHVVANAIWQKSYPNFCARCALVTDEQCGICIHNVHVCACSICSDHPTCLQSTDSNINAV
jgi:Zeta toxin